MKTKTAGVVLASASLLLVVTATEARADPAEVTVGSVDEFAHPPPGARAVDDDPPPARIIAAGPDAYRSPVRLEVGPVGVTTGRDLGIGLGAAAAFGTGTVGVRLAAAWLRAEPGPDPSAVAPLGSSLAQYTGELTLDFRKHGPLHPIFALGFGLLHVDGPTGGGNAGIGTARAGLEYSLGLEEADVRLGAWLSGVLPGPATEDMAALHGYVVSGAGVTIGL